jgi:hypothetical protein
MILTFGKYKGTPIEDLPEKDMEYLIWLSCNSWVVRKEAQSVYENWMKSKYRPTDDFEITSMKYDDDLCWDVTVKVDGERYSFKFHSKSDFEKISKEGFKVQLVYNRMFFTNQYDKKTRKWTGARLINYKPSLNIITKNSI